MKNQIENLNLNDEQKEIACQVLKLFEGKTAEFTEETLKAVIFVLPSLASL